MSAGWWVVLSIMIVVSNAITVRNFIRVRRAIRRINEMQADLMERP